ncbi:MAG: bifunctional riboflavin kinase/FAD synthetase [Bacteroidetes bacterium]|nr:bifunctional riboflavin kinase/FAD synthetase [Bacteroidota bacterium]
MTKITTIEDIEWDVRSVVTVGTFDGIHKGHQALMHRLVQTAKREDARSIVVSFDPHPRSIIHAGADGIRLLTTLKERNSVLSQLGVDLLCVIPFTRDFSLQSAEEFVVNSLVKTIGLSHFVIGYDHHFGKNRDGNAILLQQIGKEHGFDVEIVSKKEMGDTTISSTTIRNALEQNGDVVFAAQLLGRSYSFEGIVIHGDERGRTIGFPTANIRPDNPDKLIPKEGIYAVRVSVMGDAFLGMMNIGHRPTFDGKQQSIEVNIFDFEKSIYGQNIRIEPVQRIRDEKKFTNIDALKSQLHQDREECLRILGRASI